MEILNFLSRRLENVSPKYKKMNKDMDKLPTSFKIISAVSAGSLIGTAVTGCGPTGASTEQNNETSTKTVEVTNTPENSLYTANFTWNSTKIAKTASNAGVDEKDVRGHKVTIDGTVTGEQLVFEFNQFKSQEGNIRSVVYSSEFQNGVTETVASVKNVDGIDYVENSYYKKDGTTAVITSYRADASIKLAAGNSVTMKVYPTEDQLSLLPAYKGDGIDVTVSPNPNWKLGEPNYYNIAFVDVTVSNETTASESTEAQLPEGTRIDVDTTKEGWINEFPGLEKYVQVGVDGVGTMSFDGGATTFGYDSKNTIFKFAAKDNIWVAGWEFKKNVDGNFEYVDAVRIRAPRPNSDGTVEDPANVLPHFNKEDNDLMNKFISETADPDPFKDGNFSIKRRNMTPDHFKLRDADLPGFIGYVRFLPIGEDGNQDKFVRNLDHDGDPFLVQSNSSAAYINKIGVLLAGSILDSSGSTLTVKSLLQSKGYIKTTPNINDQLWFNIFLFSGIPDTESEEFLLTNNNSLLEAFNKTKPGDVTIKNISAFKTIVDKTIFSTGYAE